MAEDGGSSAFGLLSRAYDLLYRDKDYAGEAEQVLTLIEGSAGSRPRSILELGAGTGGHGVHFAGAGVAVVGVESSASMIVRARSAAGLELVQGDAREVRLGREFDAVVSLFHVLSYQNTDADVAAFFATARAHLAIGGILALDAWYSPAVLAQRPETRVRRAAGDGIHVLRIAEVTEAVDRSLVEVRYSIEVTLDADGAVERGTELHRMRHFTSNELRLFGRANGFELRHAVGLPDAQPPSRDTWGVCFVLERVS